MSSWKKSGWSRKGQDAAEAGLTQEEWKKYDTDGPNAKTGMERSGTVLQSMHIHDKGRMLSHDLLVDMWGLLPPRCEAHYRVRFAGVGRKTPGRPSDGANGRFGGKHGSAIGSLDSRN